MRKDYEGAGDDDEVKDEGGDGGEEEEEETNGREAEDAVAVPIEREETATDGGEETGTTEAAAPERVRGKGGIGNRRRSGRGRRRSRE